MGSFSIWHWMIVLLVVLLLFGSGKVSNLMGDFAKGIKSFKKNMAEDESMEASATSVRPARSRARRHDAAHHDRRRRRAAAGNHARALIKGIVAPF